MKLAVAYEQNLEYRKITVKDFSKGALDNYKIKLTTGIFFDWSLEVDAIRVNHFCPSSIRNKCTKIKLCR